MFCHIVMLLRVRFFHVFFYSWAVPTDLPEARTYRVAVWEAESGICGISDAFGISEPLVRRRLPCFLWVPLMLRVLFSHYVLVQGDASIVFDPSIDRQSVWIRASFCSV